MNAMLGHLRAREQFLMGAAVAISRAGEGAPVFNPATGAYDNPPPIEVYAGKALVRPAIRDGNDVDYGGQQVSLTTYEVTLPLDVIPEPGDTITVTASADPALTGLSLTVADVFAASDPVNRRVLAERVT